MEFQRSSAVGTEAAQFTGLWHVPTSSSRLNVTPSSRTYERGREWRALALLGKPAAAAGFWGAAVAAGHEARRPLRTSSAVNRCSFWLSQRRRSLLVTRLAFRQREQPTGRDPFQ